MAVGKGSLSRVANKATKSDIVSLAPNNVVDLDLSAIAFKNVKDNAEMVN